MNILAVFRSRAQALSCLSRIRAAGICAAAVSTPREANVGCGISLRFSEGDLFRVRRALASGRYSAFAGFMRQSGRGCEYL